MVKERRPAKTGACIAMADLCAASFCWYSARSVSARSATYRVPFSFHRRFDAALIGQAFFSGSEI